MINKYRPFVGSYKFKFVFDKKNKRVVIERKYLNPVESGVQQFLPDIILTSNNIDDPDMQELLKTMNIISYMKVFETIKEVK
jgi:hypothetical protein